MIGIPVTATVLYGHIEGGIIAAGTGHLHELSVQKVVLKVCVLDIVAASMAVVATIVVFASIIMWTFRTVFKTFWVLAILMGWAFPTDATVMVRAAGHPAALNMFTFRVFHISR